MKLYSSVKVSLNNLAPPMTFIKLLAEDSLISLIELFRLEACAIVLGVYMSLSWSNIYLFSIYATILFRAYLQA